MFSAERRAVAALWSIQGVGLKTYQSVVSTVPPSDLLAMPVDQLLKQAEFTNKAKQALRTCSGLTEVADRLEGQLRTLGHSIAFTSDAAFPPLLAQVPNAPPVLFHVGPGAAAGPRRRVAMVGTRHPDGGYARKTSALAEAVARTGIGVVSGAAEGIDRAAHLGALAAGGETWAFLGSAIEQVDAAQKPLLEDFRELGGTAFSEFPPGARPDRSTFPRRNRLISGAADAVLVVRAGATSGALHTANYAVAQGRPLLAMPGDFFNPSAAGCNALLKAGQARVCLGPEDLVEAVGLADAVGRPALAPTPLGDLSEGARQVVQVLEKNALDFDAIAARLPQLSSGALVGVLMELQLMGAVVQKPGSRYEKL